MKRLIRILLAASLVFPHQALAAGTQGPAGPKGPNMAQRVIARVASFIPGLGAKVNPISTTRLPGALDGVQLPQAPQVPLAAAPTLSPVSAAKAAAEEGPKALPAAQVPAQDLPEAAAEAGLAETAAKPGTFQGAAKRIKGVLAGKKSFSTQGPEDVLDAAASSADGGADSGRTQLSKAAEAGDGAPASKALVPAPAAETALAPQTEKKPGLPARIWSVFSTKEYTQSEKAYIAGQTIFLVAMTVQMAALALFVESITGNIADTGTAVMMQRWALAGASVFAATWVAKTPIIKVLRLTGWARAAVFGSLSVLALSGVLSFPVALGLLAVNGVLIAANTLVDLDENGANMVFDSEAKADKALYLYDNRAHALAVVLPIALLGPLMGLLNATFGAGVGPQVMIGLMGVAFALATLLYEKVKPVVSTMSRKENQLGFFATVKLMAKSVYRNQVMRGVILIRTLERFLEEAVFNVFIPIYGGLLLVEKAIAQTALVSAAELGGWIATTFLLAGAKKLKERMGTGSFLAFVSIAAALTFIPSIAFWAVHPALPIGIAIAFSMKLLYQPLRSESTRQLQRALKSDPLLKNYGAETFSVLRILIMLGAGAGGGAFSWIAHQYPEGSLVPFQIVTAALAALAFVYGLGVYWMKKGIASQERAAAAAAAALPAPEDPK